MPSITSPLTSMVTLAQVYRGIRADRQREGVKGTTRRRIEEQMEKTAERFERLIEHWVPEEELRESWRDFFYHEAAQPDEPSLPTPPLFRGLNNAGALVEVRESGEGYDVWVDGVHAEHYDVPWQLQADRFGPVMVGERACTETFRAPAEAVEALAAFLTRPGSEPPSAWARVLFEDGLIDENFGLTDRGTRRKVNEPGPTAEAPSGEVINYVVLLANAGRARFFTLQADALKPKTTYEPLLEVSDLTSGLARADDSQQFSDSRPGLRREGAHGPRHGVDDRRQGHRRESQRKYIQRIVDAGAKVWSQYEACRIVVVASPLLLTRLRPAITRRLNGSNHHHVVYDHPSDLTWQEAAAVHTALAKADLLPARTRRPPVRPMRTPNPWQQGEG